MRVQGFEVDRLRLVEEPAVNGIIPKRWLEVAISLTNEERLNTSTVSPRTILEAFWRTIVAGRDEKGNLSLHCYLRACEECYRLSSIRNRDTATTPISPGDYDALNTVALTEQSDDSKSPAMVLSFLSRVQAVTWNRRMVMTEHDALAIVPFEARDGDSIYILFGCSIPVILREYEHDVWKLIGECYVNASEIMSGEIADYGLDGRFKVGDFNLI